jgi:hypothetical protein
VARSLPKLMIAAGGVLVCVASPATSADLSNRVPGHGALTYFDLMKLVVPDLAKTKDGAAGEKIVPFRHIEGKGAKTDVDGEIDISEIDPITIAGQPDRLMLLADAGSSDESVAEIEFLGLFQLTPKPKLIDLVEVGDDRFDALESATPPLLAPGSPLIVVDSSHFNSNENYNTSELIFLKGDRFALIDSLFTFSEQFCAFDRQQTPAFAVVADTGPYKAVKASVRQTVKLTHQDGCDEGEPKPPRAGARTFAATYRWNAARQRFEADSKALDALQKANMARVEGN